MSRPTLPLALLCSLAAACGSGQADLPPAPPPPPPPPPATVAPAPPPPPPPITRAEWNRDAVRLNLPFFWASDDNQNGRPDASEIRALVFHESDHPVTVDQALLAIEHYDPMAYPVGLLPDELTRQRLVREDLDQGAPSLIATPLSSAPPLDQKLVVHLMRVAFGIDYLKATMSGAIALASRVPSDDPASQSLFRRNWGPKCVAAKTIGNPACSAIPGAPTPINDAYPASLQSEKDFCAKLEKLPNAKELVDPFTVVRDVKGKLEGVPYSTAYKGLMTAIAEELLLAANDETDPAERPLQAYLRAAAQSFKTNDWTLADEAWSRMNATNSRWYVRVGPDEVLSDPCSHKAQFHLTLAHIDQGSLAWQKKLTPVEQDMERAIAGVAGPPYKARHVAFHLPDFIQIIVNAGDDRSAVGATAGESLPNWGRVEQEGRGRTVAMTNIGTDPDSLAVARHRLEALVDADLMKSFTDATEPALLGTILHEATHNLGPTYTYVLNGKKPTAVFGGGLAAMLEELKAETGAMFFLDWVQQKGLTTPTMTFEAKAAWLAWALRHIATGVHAGADDQAYSQLSAIQVGFLMDEGALTWDPNAQAANGVDTGAFHWHPEKLAPAFAKLMKVVGAIKAKNDKAGAEALVARYVDGPVVPMKVIAERSLRFPQTTYVYSLY